MISRQQYLESITQQPELYPVLAEIISEYTGGECDIDTQEGRLCWKYKNNNDNNNIDNNYEIKDNNNNSNNKCDRYFFNSPLHLNNWLLPIVEEVDRNDTSLHISHSHNQRQQRIDVPSYIFIEKTLVISGKSIKDKEKLYFEIALNNYSGCKKLDVEFYETIYEILPKDTVNYLQKLINNYLILSQDTPMKLYNRESLLIYNASNKHLYGQNAIDYDETSLDYYSLMYYRILLRFLSSIIKNAIEKFTMDVYFHIANEDFERYSKEEEYLKNLFDYRDWNFDYLNSCETLVGINYLFNSSFLNSQMGPTSIILTTEKSFIL